MNLIKLNLFFFLFYFSFPLYFICYTLSIILLVFHNRYFRPPPFKRKATMTKLNNGWMFKYTYTHTHTPEIQIQMENALHATLKFVSILKYIYFLIPAISIGGPYLSKPPYIFIRNSTLCKMETGRKSIQNPNPNWKIRRIKRRCVRRKLSPKGERRATRCERKRKKIERKVW